MLDAYCYIQEYLSQNDAKGSSSLMILLQQYFFRLGLFVALLGSVTTGLLPAFALPPAEDEPEERLRTEIILEARSPINGKPMTAAEYAELEAELEAESRNIGTVSPDVRRLIGLLRLRKAIRTILPFF